VTASSLFMTAGRPLGATSKQSELRLPSQKHPPGSQTRAAKTEGGLPMKNVSTTNRGVDPIDPTIGGHQHRGHSRPVRPHAGVACVGTSCPDKHGLSKDACNGHDLPNGDPAARRAAALKRAGC
jgi:hypothetical protein